MRSFSLFCLFTVFCSSYAFSQFKLEEFLSSSISDKEIQLFDKQKSLLSGREVTSPFIQEVDIRLRTNDFDASPEDFRFRLDIINPREISANKNYQNQYAKTLEARKIRTLNEVLLNRYAQAAHHQYLSEMLTAENTSLSHLKLLAGLEPIEIRDLLKRDEDILKSELEILKRTSEIKKLELEMQSNFSFDGRVNWGGFNMINPDQMNLVLAADSIYSSPFLTEAESEESLAQKEFEYDVSRARSSIGFIQPEMDIDRGNEFSEHMGFQFGFNLPIINSNRARQQYEKIELLEESARVEQVKSETTLTRSQLKSEFLSSMKGLSLVNQRIDQFKELKQNPVSELKDELAKIDYERKLNILTIEYRYRLLRIYLTLLMEQGRLAATPRINYLSALLEEF